MEEEAPSLKVNFDFQKDAGITGNLEVTLFNSKHKEGLLVHTKKGGDGYISKDNVSALIAKIKAECA